MLSGESVFVHGGVIVEDPDNLLSSSSNDYVWASRDVSEFSSVFVSKADLSVWANNNSSQRWLYFFISLGRVLMPRGVRCH